MFVVISCGAILLFVASFAGYFVWSWFLSHQVPVAQGDCVFPESWNYHTISTWSEGATFCVRLAPGEYVRYVLWSDNHAFIGLFVGSGPLVTWPSEKGTAVTEPENHAWWIVDTHKYTLTELTTATSGLEFSPDGSRAITGPCYHSRCDNTVLDVVNDVAICQFGISYVWFERGCEGVTQADGEYWDIKTYVNRKGCEGWRLYAGSYPDGCEEYVDDFPASP